MFKRFYLVVTLFLLTISTTYAQTIHVAAAANLQSVFNEKIIPAFLAKTSIRVIPVYGATKTLEQQFENGAPYDVFVSADTSTAVKLASENLLDKASVKPYAIGTLVMWYLNSASVQPKALSGLTDSRIQHIAVANPQTAPYGAAAIQSLTSAKLIDQLTPKIVYAENIQQALEFGISGNAEVSFTALSLVIHRTDGTWVAVPSKLHAPILQSLGVSVTAPDAARQFAAFLTSKDVDKIWTSSGYELPKK